MRNVLQTKVYGQGRVAAALPKFGLPVLSFFWAAREIWSKQVFKEVCMYVCMLLFCFVFFFEDRYFLF